MPAARGKGASRGAKAVSQGRAPGKAAKTAGPKVVSAGKNNVRTKQTNQPQVKTAGGKGAAGAKKTAGKGVPLNQSAMGTKSGKY